MKIMDLQVTWRSATVDITVSIWRPVQVTQFVSFDIDAPLSLRDSRLSNNSARPPIALVTIAVRILAFVALVPQASEQPDPLGDLPTATTSAQDRQTTQSQFPVQAIFNRQFLFIANTQLFLGVQSNAAGVLP
jgi:hypothetical protein